MTESIASLDQSFVVTKEYRRFAEFCDACRRHRYIGLCYGPPGVGKTLSAQQYASWDRIESLETYYGRTEPPPPDVLPCRTVFYTPPVANTPSLLGREIYALCRKLSILVGEAGLTQPRAEFDPLPWEAPDCVELVVVDEADRLKMAALEHMRDMYDRGRFGLILVGMPGLEKRLSRYAQLYSRVGFVHAFRPLSVEELRFILEHHWDQFGLPFNRADWTDVEAVSTIIRMTGGNFRLLKRLFTQIQRILEINHLTTVTKEVIEAARDSLIIGSL